MGMSGEHSPRVLVPLCLAGGWGGERKQMPHALQEGSPASPFTFPSFQAHQPFLQQLLKI